MTTCDYSSSRIIHISDIHCTTRSYTCDIRGNLNPIDEGDPQDTIAKCSEIVNFLKNSRSMLRTHRIVITGDLVDSAFRADSEQLAAYTLQLSSGPDVTSVERDEFKAYAKQYLLEPLTASGFDVIVVPGNHDYFVDGNQFVTPSIAVGRMAFFDAFSSYLKTWAPDGYPVDLDLRGGNHLILIDSFKGHYDVETDSHRAQGNVGEQQQNWLRNTLPIYQQGREGGIKIAIALHNNPFDTNGDTELADAVGFLGVISNRIDALMFGHTGPPHQFYADQARFYKIPIVTSENIEHMMSTGYPISVIDLSCNIVEVYSTKGYLMAVEGIPDYSYGSQGEATLITFAME
jgi:hypothetical protein